MSKKNSVKSDIIQGHSVKSDIIQGHSVKSDIIQGHSGERVSVIDNDRLTKIDNDRLTKIDNDRLTKIDNDRFAKVRDRVLSRERGQMGIGTLQEKTVHMVLKEFFEADLDYHEVAIGNYVADICRGQEIIEIQTAGFDKMRSKLNVFLVDHKVTIVYPIPYIKWINWMDNDSLEVVERRKSPKKGTPYQIFFELYKIQNLLNNDNLCFKIVLINVEEYRLLCGWSKDKKKGSVRYDRIPQNIVQIIDICQIKDYVQLVPYELPELFTAKEYAKETKLTSRKAWGALKVLENLKIIRKEGKKGKAFLYKCIEFNMLD